MLGVNTNNVIRPEPLLDTQYLDRIVEQTINDMTEEERRRMLDGLCEEFDEKMHIISPGGNTTVLLEGRKEQQYLVEIAQKIIEQLIAEQVGTIDTSPTTHDATVTMMGGEFCLNAVRAAAALLHANEAQQNILLMRCSGNEESIECGCRDIYEKGISVTSTRKISPEIKRINDDINLVHLGGISHFVVLVKENEPDTKHVDDFKDLIQQYEQGQNLNDVPAIGVIFYEETKRGVRIQPFVHVRETQTYIKETGCASGSEALATILHMKDEKKQQIGSQQPSGEIYNTNIQEVEDGLSAIKISLESIVYVRS